MRWRALAAVPFLIMVSCRAPWTIVPIDAQEAGFDDGKPFDAAAYAASIWESKVVPAANAAPEFAPGAHGLVKGSGRVLKIDAARQRLVLDIAPFDGKPDAELDVGSVHGTALRDALSFIQFGQFLNQVDYAHAANALDDRSAQAASAALTGVKKGDTVRFSGALIPAEDGLPAEIVPVTVERQ